MFEKYDIMLLFLKQEWSEILIQSIRDNIILISKFTFVFHSVFIEMGDNSNYNDFISISIEICII